MSVLSLGQVDNFGVLIVSIECSLSGQAVAMMHDGAEQHQREYHHGLHTASLSSCHCMCCWHLLHHTTVLNAVTLTLLLLRWSSKTVVKTHVHAKAKVNYTQYTKLNYTGSKCLPDTKCDSTNIHVQIMNTVLVWQLLIQVYDDKCLQVPFVKKHWCDTLSFCRKNTTLIYIVYKTLQ